MGNLSQMKKVVTADRGREKVFIDPKRMNVRGGREENEGGQMYSQGLRRKTAKATLYNTRKAT